MKKRLKNWPSLLVNRMEELRSEPFAWGKNDCCLLAASLIESITGSDPMRNYRGTYSTHEEGEALLANLGGIESAADTIAEGEGWPEIEIPMMGRGDLALIRHAAGESLGICVGGLIVSAAPEGLAFFPRKTVRKAWRVG